MDPTIVLTLFFIIVFIIIEIGLSIYSRNKTFHIIKLNILINSTIEIHPTRNEDLFVNLSEEERKYPALDYLATCVQTGQQIDVENFKELLISKTNTAFYNINSIMNQLPIIGLMGTFLGIIIGVVTAGYNIIQSKNINPDSFILAENIILSFFQLVLLSSSLCALICASLLKLYFGKEEIYRIQ